jgi:hypothetical protein
MTPHQPSTTQDIIATVHDFVTGRVRDLDTRLEADETLTSNIQRTVADIDAHVRHLNDKLALLDGDIATLRTICTAPAQAVAAACRRNIVDTASAVAQQHTEKAVRELSESIPPVAEMVRDAQRVVTDDCRAMIDFVVETKVMPRVRAIVDTGRSECIEACVRSEVASMTARVPWSRIDGGPVMDGDTLVVPNVRLKGWGECELLSAGNGMIVDGPRGRIMSVVAESNDGSSLRVPGSMACTPAGTTFMGGVSTRAVSVNGMVARDNVYVGSYRTVVTDAHGSATVTETPVDTIHRGCVIGCDGRDKLVGLENSRVAIVDAVAGIESDGTVFGTCVRTDCLMTNRIKGDVQMDGIDARYVRTGSLKCTSDGFVMPIHDSFPENAPDGSVVLMHHGLYVRLHGTWRPVA